MISNGPHMKGSRLPEGKTFCEQSTASLTADELQTGISKRLELLTSLFCPEDEEDPDRVLGRLRIESGSVGEGFEEFLLYYRADEQSFIPMVRYDRGGVLELLEELSPASQGDRRLSSIIERLSRVTEDVSFCLKDYDVQGMGFPLSIAAAAYLVERAGGLIQSGTYSWMIPKGNQVDILLELNR